MKLSPRAHSVLLVAISLLALAETAWQLAARLQPSAAPGSSTRVADLAWIEPHVRGLEEVGWWIPGAGDDAQVWVPGDARAVSDDLDHPDHDRYEYRRAKLEAAIAPTRLVPGPREVTIFAFRSGEPGPKRAAIEAQGFEHAVVPAGGALAIGFQRAPGEAMSDAGPLRHEASGLRVALLLLVLLVPVGLAARHAREAAGLQAAGSVFALACATMVADAVGAGPILFGALVVVGLGLLLGLVLRAVPPGAPSPGPALGPRLVVLAALGLGLAGFGLRLAASPEGMLDAQVMFSLRARWILTDSSFWAPFAAAIDWPQQHPDYPPLLAFANAGAWRLVGADVPHGPALVQLLAWLGAALAAAGWIARRSTWGGVALFTLLVASPVALRLASWLVADGLLASFLLCAAVAGSISLKADRTWRGSAAGLAGAFLAAAAATKNEGIVLALGTAVAVVVVSLNHVDVAVRVRAFLLPLAGGLLLIAGFKSQVPTNDLVADGGLAYVTFDRVGTLARRVGGALSHPLELRAIIPALVGFALLAGAGRGARWGAAWVTACVLMFASVYLVTPYDLDWHLDTSLMRVLAQPLPVAAFALVGGLVGSGER